MAAKDSGRFFRKNLSIIISISIIIIKRKKGKNIVYKIEFDVDS